MPQTPPEVPTSMWFSPRALSALPRRTSSCQKVLPPSMMTSPGCISLARSSMVASVILPAGSITQAVRGFSSFATKSSSELAPVAPSAASPATALESLSYTTDVWPFLINRRTMLPPIRPRPIMPSCIRKIPLIERFRDGGIQRCKRRLEVTLEMDTQRAPAAFGQHVEIAARLRRLDDAKAGFLARHRQIPGVVGRDLQEYAAAGSALVGLAGRMQEARAEFGAGRNVAPVADLQPHLLQRVDRRAVACDISQQRKIIAAAGA